MSACPVQPHPLPREFHQNQYVQPRRLRAAGVTSTERNWAIAIHLSVFASMVFGPLIAAPLIIWLIRKDDSAFNDDHGREFINFGLSFIIWHVILAITLVGLMLWPVLWVIGLINLIRAAVAAGNGEFFRYPMTFRFI